MSTKDCIQYLPHLESALMIITSERIGGLDTQRMKSEEWEKEVLNDSEEVVVLMTLEKLKVESYLF